MPVITVPHDQDPRRMASPMKIEPYSYDPKSFPMCPSCFNCSSKFSIPTQVRTWTDVVLHGLLLKAAQQGLHAHGHEEGYQTSPITSPAATDTFLKFIELPGELRLIIWDFSIRDQPYSLPDGSRASYGRNNINIRDFVKASDNPRYPKFLPSICFVSKHTMEETIAVVIEISRFMIASFHDNVFLQTFLKDVPGRLKHCRQLNFDYFSRFPDRFEKNADLELAVACSGLQTIKLTFHYEPLTFMAQNDDLESYSYRPRSGQFLFEKFRLSRLLDCDKLRTVVIEHTGYYMDPAIEAAKSLGGLINDKFAQKTPAQRVLVQYARQPGHWRPVMY